MRVLILLCCDERIRFRGTFNYERSEEAMPRTAPSLPISAIRRSFSAVEGKAKRAKSGHFGLEENRKRMVELLTELVPTEGFHATVLDGVKLRRSDRNEPRTPVLYEPSLYFVASGRKKGYVGDRCIVYDANNYLVLSVPLPFECEAETGEEGEPLLGISVRLDIGVISELAATLDRFAATQSVQEAACVYATTLDVTLGEAVVRLLESLRSSEEALILGPSIKREITYRVLSGPRQETLLAMLGRNGDHTRIHSVLRAIHTRFAEPLSVAGLAAEFGMSVSAFHHRFKGVTSTSPLQYLKAVRLHKARMLILHDRLGAALAADRVGYESASQFSREFKRLFGHSPTDGVHAPGARGPGRVRDRNQAG
jgi:AraC-like DNA-binding protein